MKHTMLVVCSLFLITSSVNAAEVLKKVTKKEARTLAAIAEGGSTKYINDFLYNGHDGWNHAFYVYDGMSSSPGAEGSFGSYAVNPWTGDVWSQWDCKKIGTPASLKLQAKIKKRFTSTELKSYTGLSRLKPSCVLDYDDKP